MKNQDTNAEQILLANTSLDDLIKKKIESEYVEEIEKAKAKKVTRHITDIKQVPPKLIFSANSVFKVYNRKSKTESCINGVQAEALLGLQANVRDSIARGSMSSFANGDVYVKFEYTEFCE